MAKCDFDPCDREATPRGILCKTHRQQQYNGAPLTPIGSTVGRRWADSEIPHGTPGGYTNNKCRCDLCTIAWNAYCSGRKAADFAKSKKGEKIDLGNVLHGSASGYQRGCKCDDCRAAHSEYTKERKINTAFKYSEEGQALLAKYNGLCMCCGEKPGVVVDHIHGTSLIRGWLCHGCNTGIGKLGDTIDGVSKAIKYLTNNVGIDYNLTKVPPSLWG